jgi:hypothetical protein
MQTVSELNSFRKSALSADMLDDEITALINYLAKNPDAGDEITGTGGCRKLRFALKSNNKGKSGGARIVTFFSGVNMPVYLIAAFKKGDKINLTKAERNALKAVTIEIVKSYANRVTRLKAGATA